MRGPELLAALKFFLYACALCNILALVAAWLYIFDNLEREIRGMLDTSARLSGAQARRICVHASWPARTRGGSGTSPWFGDKGGWQARGESIHVCSISLVRAQSAPRDDEAGLDTSQISTEVATAVAALHKVGSGP